MNAEQVFYFRPAARLQRFLGRELIADPNVAIIEFVKNSYDAGATSVEITFAIDATPSRLTIADDGVGLTVSQFERNWMHPGYSGKAGRDSPGKPGSGATVAAAREQKRVPVGEKGIGRLAAGRLGEVLDIYTRRAGNQPWLHVHFRWADFDSMTVPLDKVPIAYDQESPVAPAFSSGTILVISELTQKWADRVRGRAVRGRSRTKLGRLKQDLEFLLRPLAKDDDAFAIKLASDRVQEAEDVGEITPASAIAETAYKYEFEYTVNGSGTIKRKVTRSSRAVAETGARPQEHLPDAKIDRATAKDEDRPAELICGPFGGRFLYDPPAARHRASELDISPVGVLLYRDGLLVEPYGIGENDWLGARARKAQRQGYALQPDTLSGEVVITRRDNPALRDQSNRLGLLDAPESENFLDHLQSEFLIFERLVRNELLKTRWEESAGEKAAKQARESQERAQILLRGLAHGLRQPLQGLGFEVATLKAIREQAELPPVLDQELGGVVDRVVGYVSVAENLIEPLLARRSVDFALIPVSDLIDAAIDQTRTLAEAAKVAVHADSVKRSVIVPGDLVVQALASLLANAIEAPRADGTAGDVSVSATQRGDGIAVRVADNGTGIPGVTSETALASIESTKGRPQVGLQNAETSVVAARGRLTLVDTGSAGTTFEMLLPTKAGGLG
jgi:signal transduction histidine kinase